jgi:hypothetical protein
MRFLAKHNLDDSAMLFWCSFLEVCPHLYFVQIRHTWFIEKSSNVLSTFLFDVVVPPPPKKTLITYLIKKIVCSLKTTPSILKYTFEVQ